MPVIPRRLVPGRHRAPRPPQNHVARTAALAVTLTATTSGGITLADVAAAAPSVNWDAVAKCESGGDWSIRTGNGYSGGLQFLPSTWVTFGGREFATAAHLASREQQIVVAERVLRGQGIGAWPVCGKKGLGGTTVTAAAVTTRPTPSSTPRPPKVPDQPKAVQEAVAASGPTNPACVSLKDRGIPVGQLDALNRAHPELRLDGNRNGVPCDVTYPRASAQAPRTSTSGSVTTAASKAGSAVASTSLGAGARIVATARQWVGVSYAWGGNTRRGVDCSGLVQQVFKANGISLPRTARAQMASTQRITRSEARPGDLVGDVAGTHIGIVVGPGLMIDAPRPGKSVGVRPFYRDMTVFGRVTR